MKTHLLTSLRTLAVFTLLTGFAYPLAVTGLSRLFFKEQAEGSLLTRNGKVIGSSLLAQKFTSPRYFQSRPSACDYGAMLSGASNLSPTSPALQQAMQERATTWNKPAGGVPVELHTTSGSGLDPHLSPAAALFQAERIATARVMPVVQVKALMRQHIEAGILNQPLVNVLELNLIMDAGEKSQHPASPP